MSTKDEQGGRDSKDDRDPNLNQETLGSHDQKGEGNDLESAPSPDRALYLSHHRRTKGL